MDEAAVGFFGFSGKQPCLRQTQTFFLKSFFKKFRRKFGFTVNEQHLLHELCNDIRKVERSYFSPKVCTVAREVKFFGGNRVVEDVAERKLVFTGASSELIE